MRLRLAVAVAGLAAVVSAQTANAPALNLRGDRFKPLTYEALAPAQRAMVDDILHGERTSLDGPFNVLLRSPQMGDLAQKFGAYARYHSSLPKKLNEFAILVVGRHWNAQFEWYAHQPFALQAGLNQAVIDALRDGKRPVMDKGETAVYNFCTELLRTSQVSDATFAAAKDQFGEQGVVDLLGVIGYYTFVSMLLNVDRYPLPAGAKPELKVMAPR